MRMSLRGLPVAVVLAACGSRSTAPDAGPPVCGATILDAVHTPPPVYPTDPFASRVALGDVDGDGDLDAVVGDEYNWVEVLLNDGAGRFGPPAKIPGAVWTFALADMDGSGSLDLIAVTVVGISAYLTVWTNDGAGAFSLASQATNEGDAIEIATGDLDGDGDLDAISAGWIELAVYANDGTGQLTKIWTAPYGFDTWDVALADLDGDGHLDLASALAELALMPGTGMGFGDGIYRAIDLTSVAAADADGDGDVDLLATDDYALMRLENQGEWQFVVDRVPTARATAHVMAVDVDGDGLPEVLASGSGGVWVWPAGGEPRFAAIHRWPKRLAAGDVDGDGAVDVVALVAHDELSVLLNDGAGVFGPEPPPELPTGAALEAVLALDVDGDVDLDLLTPTSLLRQDEGWTSLTLPRQCLRYEEIAAADLDGDGDPDLARACEEEVAIELAINDGAAGFSERPLIQLVTAPEGLIAADIDGDGDQDLVTAGYDPMTGDAETGVVVLRNGGAASFALEAPIAAGQHPESLVAVDIDADGDPDLVAADEIGGRVHILANDGAGRFAARGDWPAGEDPEGLGVGDLNGDGALDLVVVNDGFYASAWRESGGVSVLFADGAGHYAAPVEHPAGLSPRGVTLGDVDGDGDLDVLAANSFSNDVAILINDGTGVLAEPVFVLAGLSPFAVLVADLDSACGPELIVANKSGGSVSVIWSSPVSPGTD